MEKRSNRSEGYLSIVARNTRLAVGAMLVLTVMGKGRDRIEEEIGISVSKSPLEIQQYDTAISNGYSVKVVVLTQVESAFLLAFI